MLKSDKEFHRFLWHPLYDNDTSLWEPKEVVADAKRLHADVIHWHITGSSSRSNYVFYQSKLLPVFPLIGKRDLLGEMVEECHRNGIYLIAYLNIHWAPNEFFEKHPTWAQVDPEGKTGGAIYGRGWAMCTNVESYRQEWIRPMLEEVAAAYDIDGIFLDGPARRVKCCYCADCRSLFREAYGAEPPAEENWDNPDFRNWIRFGYESETSIIQFVMDVSRQSKPGLPVYANGTVLKSTWFLGISTQNAAKVADLVGAEAFMYYIRPLDVPAWKSSAVSKYLQSCAPDKPRVTYLCYGQKPWHASPLSPDQQQVNIAAAAANGCCPFMTIEDFSRRDQRSYPAIGEMYEFIERNQDAYAGAKSMANVGLVFSQLTSDFYEQGVITAAGGTHDYYCKSRQTYEEEYKGFYEALMHSGGAFDMICDEAMNEENLARFDVVVLPNTACLTPAATELLKKHVRGGGGLVASYHASCFDAEGLRLSAPALAEELGIAEVRGTMQEATRDFMRMVAEHPVTGDIPPGTDVVLPKDNLNVRPTESATPLAYAMELRPYTYAPTGKPTDAGAVIANEQGGRCVYFSGLIGAHYLTYGVPDFQGLIARAVRWAAKDVAAQVTGSPNVEITLFRKGEERFIHLINYTSRAQLPIQHIESVRGLTIELPWDGKTTWRAHSLWSGRDLPVTAAAGRLRIALDEMRIYELICLTPVR